MKLFFDSIIFYLQRSGGISLYWHELIKRFVNDSDAQVEVNYSLENSGNIFCSSSESVERKPNFLKLFRYFDFYVSGKADIVHSSYYRIPYIKNTSKILTTVHDYTYEYYRNGIARTIHSWQKERAISFSDGIIAISNNTKNDILKFNPSVNPDKICVIYNGISSHYFQINNACCASFKKSAGDYVLFVGGRSGYKNFSNIVPAVASIFNLKLYIVGAQLTANEAIFLNQYLFGRYKFFGNVDNYQLNNFYNSAVALLYPSSYEGFGLPVAEAMAAGCPVIATNASSIPEVAGEAAILLEIPDSENIANAIMKLRDVEYRNTLIDLGLKQSARFNWDCCYRQTKSFYEKIIS